MTRINPTFALLAASLAVSIGHSATAQTRGNQAPVAAPRVADITKNGAITLIRSAMIALDQANKTGNYTVLRDLGSPQFQAANSAARLADIFARQRRDGLDLSGVVAVDPVLNGLPQIESNGMMRMVGFFPSVPQQINFELLYAPVDRQWKLFGLSVDAGGNGAPAPPSPTAGAPPPRPAPPSANRR